MMHNLLNKIPLIFLSLVLLTGCASKPAFDASEANRSLTPQSVLAEPEVNQGDTAIWGGTILDIRNLEKVTQIEMLAYPLNSSERPRLDRPPLGRFIIRHEGFLEPTSYAQGQLLTVLGNIGEKQTGSVGDSTYIYPVINSQKLHLWSGEPMLDRTSFHFGVGIGL